ncbi:MAG: T9SS type A sorting domain-containing protein, partial [Eudoraea sp.]|nr:T9SS type A sorting domain-containing protein [Eudoraea sp.]
TIEDSDLSLTQTRFDDQNCAVSTTLLVNYECGQATCEFDVFVEDAQSPNAICYEDATVILNGVTGTLTVEDVDNGSSDNCGIASMSICPSEFDQSFPVLPGLLDNSVSPTPGWTFNYDNIVINGVNNPFNRSYNVAPGGSITLELDWTLTFDPAYSPGSNQQFYIGLNGDGSNEECIFNGPASGTTVDNNTISFNAPTAPGIYAVSLANSLGNSCSPPNLDVRDVLCGETEDGIVAIITVFAGYELTTTLTVTDFAGNISTCTALVEIDPGPASFTGSSSSKTSRVPLEPGIEEETSIVALPELTIAPNPSGFETTISITGLDHDTDLNIFDVSGRQVHFERLMAGTNKVVIDLTESKFQSGIYIIRVLVKDQIFTEKLIVQK